jgi:glycosyltransferase involved in cell wall biosynthesis
MVNFAEPFGLSMAESLACGTPVIGRRRGSVPEVVRHGIDGFVVDSLDAAVAAVGTVARLDRTAISAAARCRFSAERMVDDYIRAYREIIHA